MKGYVHVHTQIGYETYMRTLAIVQEVDDYDYTFEAESILKEVLDALKEGDGIKAEELTLVALAKAEEAKIEKSNAGDEDDDWEEDW